MTEDQEYEVFAKRMETNFPLMFAGQYGGFAVGAGWYPIIEALCGQIESHLKHRNGLAAQYPDQHKPVPQVVVEQIKEKFGGLRFYYEGGDDTIYGMVRMAESWAGRSCEDCGAPGHKTSGGWIKTLCTLHIMEREAQAADYARKNGFEQ